MAGSNGVYLRRSSKFVRVLRPYSITNKAIRRLLLWLLQRGNAKWSTHLAMCLNVRGVLREGGREGGS